jgi:hypothetical protein
MRTLIRALLVLACVLAVAVVLLGMWRGWRKRGLRQSNLADLPNVPADLGDELLAAMIGIYVGTTFATSWQDRVVHAGLGRRSNATARLYERGVLIERYGDTPIFIPTEAIADAHLSPGLAGKVVGEGGLLVIRWRLGMTRDGVVEDVLLDSGLRADYKSVYPEWVRTINAKVASDGLRSENGDSL